LPAIAIMLALNLALRCRPENTGGPNDTLDLTYE
jgi:hypothetical protein